MMYKYKYFLALFTIIAILLLWFYFPICFDNNDDQAMFAISSGWLSGVPSANVMLSNVLYGKLLSTLFSLNNSINWYTLILQLIFAICWVYLLCYFLFLKKNTLIISVFISAILLLGFIVAAITRPQFTSVALCCMIAALFTLYQSQHTTYRFAWFVFFIIVAILIRAESFFIFLVFALPIYFWNKSNRKQILRWIAISILLFFVFYFVHYVFAIRPHEQNYMTLQTIDIIAAKPISIKEKILFQNNFSVQDIHLIQSWLMADDAYNTQKMHALATALQSNRNCAQVFFEWKKFAQEERYLLVFYLFSLIAILFFAKKYRKFVLWNLILFLTVVLYLSITSRIPHRVTYPLLCYLVLFNIFHIIKSDFVIKIKYAILSIFLLLSLYKFYCVLLLIPLHQSYQQQFEKTVSLIRQHDDLLFIGADAFPLQYMNAWQAPSPSLLGNNLMLAGWYATTPDYQLLLSQHQLKNLTNALSKKSNVIFLSASSSLQAAYIQVMKERYGIACHFEPIINKGYPVDSKRLVFDAY